MSRPLPPLARANGVVRPGTASCELVASVVAAMSINVPRIAYCLPARFLDCIVTRFFLSLFFLCAQRVNPRFVAHLAPPRLRLRPVGWFVCGLRIAERAGCGHGAPADEERRGRPAQHAHRHGRAGSIIWFLFVYNIPKSCYAAKGNIGVVISLWAPVILVNYFPLF